MGTHFKGRLLQGLPFFFFPAMVCLFLGLLFQATAAEPWPDREKLTYEVHWGMLVAAEGTFQAHRTRSDWRLSLDLKSRGMVSMLVPIQSRFDSRVGPDLWRSLFFQADRHEGKEKLIYECELPGTGAEGEYRDLLEHKNRKIQAADGPVQDLVSMLYGLRRHDWKKDSKMKFRVNDRWSLHSGFARVVGRETIEDQKGVERECDVIFVQEVDDKGEPKKNGWLRLWFTADEKRVPLQARLKFRYGTFLIRIKPSGQ